MEWYVITILLALLAVLLVALLIVVCVRRYRDKKEMEKYYEAARQMVKEESLNYSLKNPYLKSCAITARSPQKIMLYVKFIKSNEKGGVIFDPEKVVIFGRQKEQVSVCINEAVVSSKHCQVYLSGGEIWLEDMNSANGTCLIRKRKEYRLSPGYPIMLADKDVLHVGSRYFQIQMFYYDMTMM